MLILTAIAAVALADPAAPELRVPAADLRLSDPAHVAEFAARTADKTRAFCADHRALITPAHVTDPLFCERAMAQEVVRALPEARRAEFHRSGGRLVLARLQRQASHSAGRAASAGYP